jgi:hypothetical protein
MPKRQTIRKGGQVYELKHISEFGPLEQHSLNRDGQEFAEIWNSSEDLRDENGKPTDRGARVLLLLNRLFDEVLIADDDVKASFDAGQRAQVVLSFTVAPARQLAQLMAMISSQPGSQPVTTS